ncbi:WD40 domain-containing protein/Bromodomain domain-containing protein [Cephalotus follicularis]|uniref:WD40 domain-containing protein/Bromodomain domain-containing protein n=1 Tax=Cephalotus follicularis TaxID=3775 RepID=A0A1Q3CTR0_CEPFO|nr:WD40 domain-containing protein/Bromodomain domain-containing protein [Cephalotus follicularis]
MDRKCTISGGASSHIEATLNFSSAVVQEKAQFEQQDRVTGHKVETDLDIDLREVYFLILHFLSAGPCQRTFEQFKNELLEHRLLPRRYHAWSSRSGLHSENDDDDGISFPLSYNKLVERYSHVENDHLVKLLKQLLLHTESPLHGKVGGNALNAADVPTLLGYGSFSLYQSDRSVEYQPVKSVPSYVRWPHMQVDQVHGLTLREIGGGFAKHHRAPSIRSACYAIAKPSTMVQKMQNIKKLRGHREAVYCAIFDRSGRYVITGSDDRLVKIWSMETAFCLVSCRGHEGDITDLAVSSNNALVASASNDFVIRVWRLPDGLPISVLRGHTGAVTAIAFSPRPSSIYQLLSSSDDGTCRIWDARYSNVSPRIYLPKPSETVTGKTNGPSNNGPSSSNSLQIRQILCCAYNANGTVFVTGSSDTLARVWSACKSNTEDSERPVHELDVLIGHENDVNYVQFSGCAVASRSSLSDTSKEDSVPRIKTSWFCHDNIVTCSRDGSAIIWIPRSRRSHVKIGRWTRAYHLKVPPPPLPPQPPRGGPRQRFLPTPRGVNMIVWSLDNRFVLAAIMDCRICVWNAVDGSLVHSLTGHTASSYVLDVHPFNPRIAMSAGYDGRTIVWDIWDGTPIRIYEIGRFKLVDGKFSPDGTSIVLSDDVGQIYLLNTGQGESHNDAKYDQFFLGDYRPLIRDTLGNVLDQESQLVPHRRNFQDPLCDASMLPYPEPYQTVYQRRRLGALGLEWRPSSIKFAVGLDISLGQDYEMPPLADLERMIEPLPEFIDAMYWEPENEVISDDTDSEYNVTDECSSGGGQRSLCFNSSSDPECTAEDSEVERNENDSFRRSRRKLKKVELMTSSGRRIKKRNLDERDGSKSGSRKAKKSRSRRIALKMKSSKAKSLRPQRVAARNALTMFSTISGTSTDGDDGDDSEDDTSDKESLIVEPNGFAKPREFPESQANIGIRKRLVLKFSLRDSMKLAPSEDTRPGSNNQTDLGHRFSEDQDITEENRISIGSKDPGSSSADASIVELSGTYDRINFTDRRHSEKAEYHPCESASDKENNIRWGEVKIRTSKRSRQGDLMPADSSAEINAGPDLLKQNRTDVNWYVKPLNKFRLFCPLCRNPKYRDASRNLNDIVHEMGKPYKARTEFGDYDGVMEEDTLDPVKYHGSRIDFPEAATDAVRRTRSLKMKATSRELNALSRDIKVRVGHKSVGMPKITENYSTKPQSEKWISSSKNAVRPRSVRNRRGGEYDNDPSFSVGRKPNHDMRKPSWLMLSEHEEGYRYIPQLGDVVVYLRQGHQEFVETSCMAEIGPWRLIKGYIRAVETCKIENIVYTTFPGSGDSCCKLTLKFIDASSGVYGKALNLTLPELVSFPDFLVEKTRYDASISRNWTHRDKCLVWWRNENEEGGSWWEGRILSLEAKSDEFPDSPWERCIVRYKTDPAENHLHSPWELHDPEIPWEPPHIEIEIRDKLLSSFAKLEQSVSRNQDYYGIQKLNEAAQKLDFFNRFPVPLYPDVIRSRLENNYYRNLEAVKHDITVMLANGQTYFSKNAQLSTNMRHLSDWFTRKLSKL